jgi:hypothetical protein
MYPGLFCAEDLQRRKQEPHGYGFTEWFTSIYLHLHYPNCTIFRRSYFREKDPMYSRASEVLGDGGMEVLRRLTRLPRTNPPDLLVQPTSGKFFFVEARRHPDKLRDNQQFVFPKIETELGCRVMIATLKRVREIEDSSMPEECRKAFENCGA